ncbi:Phosphoenolpyruvate/pyruvate domain-containing protein [Rickenella mellea]|uniref:Phosphoenolpyruvate/pyruvate domain-containing protein n=1 Tax=Rickenella mellea TaxID=50990 RepID=A0A4Y7PMI5_9AGAM|nr:Phosphoenolpyruvate/pyruvate domain-containing protein [Rickenella mellea]
MSGAHIRSRLWCLPSTPLRNELQAGKTASGVWNTLPGTALVRTIASTPGISWVVIDAEHGQLNDTNIYEHATAIASQGISPIVRIPVDDAWWIKPVVRASKYPPIGIRGFGPVKSHDDCLCRLARLANVEEIDGLDVLFRILSAAHKFGKKAAIYFTSGELARTRAAQGFDMVVVTDVDVLSQAISTHVNEARKP